MTNTMWKVTYTGKCEGIKSLYELYVQEETEEKARELTFLGLQVMKKEVIDVEIVNCVELK